VPTGILQVFYRYFTDAKTERTCYKYCMTQLLEQAIARIRTLPPKRQDEIAEAVLAAATESHVYTPAQIAAMEEGYAQAERGEFVPESEVAAFFAKHRAI
jgi:hypothetical protein